jgi:hypothetical protein
VVPDNFENKEVDKLLNDYFSKTEIPDSTKQCVNDVLEKIAKKHKRKIQLTKVAIIIVSLGVLGTGASFAKNLTNDMKERVAMFPVESTQAIESAVQNNYVEKIENAEFVYSNGVGIKLEEVTMDDNLLNIAYDVTLENNVSPDLVQIEEYVIKDDKNKILATDIETNLKNIFCSDMSSGYVSYYKTEKYCSLFQSVYNKNFPDSNSLYIEINKVSATVNNEIIDYSGNWKFEVNLDDKFRCRASELYTYTTNDKIKNIVATMSDLSFTIEIEFNEDIDIDVVEKTSMVLQDSEGNIINCFERNINPYRNTVIYVCDICKYSANRDQLSLYMKYNYGSYKNINIVLKKQN